MSDEQIHFTVPTGAREIQISFEEKGIDMREFEFVLTTTDPTPGTQERECVSGLRIVRKGNG